MPRPGCNRISIHNGGARSAKLFTWPQNKAENPGVYLTVALPLGTHLLNVAKTAAFKLFNEPLPTPAAQPAESFGVRLQQKIWVRN
jgi:hypothetical protein